MNARRIKSATKNAPAASAAEQASKLEVAVIRLQRARHVVHCIECAAAAGSEIELGPVAFVAVDLIDRVLEDLMPFGFANEDAAQD